RASPWRRRGCCGFFFQAEDGIRGRTVTGVQTCALPISGLLAECVDGAYNAFGQKAGVPAKLHTISATGNVVWRLPSVGISPYLRSEERRVGKEWTPRWRPARLQRSASTQITRPERYDEK